MNRSHGILILALFVVACGCGWLLRSRGAPPPASALHGSEQSAEPRRSSLLSEESAATSDRAAVEQATLNNLQGADVVRGPSAVEGFPTQVRVRVLSLASEPIAGAEVTLSLIYGGELPKPNPAPVASTDRTGVATFALDGPVTWIGAQTPGGNGFAAGVLESRKSAEFDVVNNALELTIVVGVGALVRGSVLDIDDRPVPGAIVEWRNCAGWNDRAELQAPSGSLRADGMGRFEVANIGPKTRLSARSVGMSAYSDVDGIVAEGFQLDGVVLRVAPSVEVVGIVSMGDVPVKGASVILKPGTRGSEGYDGGLTATMTAECETETDASGRFRFRGQVAGQAKLNVSIDGVRVVSQRIERSSQLLEIDLPPWRSFELLVVGDTGEPVEDATVKCSAAAATEEQAATTDARGALTLQRVAVDGLLRIEASHPDFAESATWSGEFHELPELLTLTLVRGCVVLGSVVDRSSAPVTGLEITMQAVDASQEPRWTNRNYRTMNCADGSFTLRVPDARLGRLTVWDYDTDAILDEFEVCCSVEPIEIVVDRDSLKGVNVKGVVRNAVTGRPLDVFEIILLRYEGRSLSRSYETVSAPDGHFEILGLRPGEYAVAVQALGMAMSATENQQLDIGQHHFEFELVPSTHAQLRVLDAAGAPIEGVYVFHVGDHGRVMDYDVRDEGGSVTDSDGVVNLVALPAQLLQLEVRAPWRAILERFELDLSTALPSPHEVRLQSIPREELSMRRFQLTMPEGELLKGLAPSLEVESFDETGLPQGKVVASDLTSHAERSGADNEHALGVAFDGHAEGWSLSVFHGDSAAALRLRLSGHVPIEVDLAELAADAGAVTLAFERR